MDFDPTPYPLVDSILMWLIVGGAIALMVTLITVVVAMLTGVRGLAPRAKRGLSDFLLVSPRRVWALTMLTFRESVRRKVLLVFVLFAMLFMFAGWFLSGEVSQQGAKIHISFVLTAISWIVLPVALLLSCWGLPEDIRLRSLHTVVTKPARRSEIVLGRMFGFAMVGSVIVAVMSVVGYVWMQRQSPYLVSGVDEFVQDGESVKRVQFANPLVIPQDKLEVKVDGKANLVESAQDLKSKLPDVYRLYVDALNQAQEDVLACRVPVHGALIFLDSEGKKTSKGLNTGDIWEFRSYIAGNSKQAAIWDFDGINQEQLGDTLRLEARFETFRTHKGKIDEKLRAKFILVNPDSGLRVPLDSFAVNEYHDGDNVTEVKRKIQYFDETTAEEKSADLYDELVVDGKLRVEVRCLDSGQFLGMARPDLFVRAPDRKFASGFFKACFCIWLSMLVVVMLGVTGSCFLKGPVATLLTLVFLILGQGLAMNFLEKVTGDKWKGGGILESSVKIVKQHSLTAPLEESQTTTVIKKIDQVGSKGLFLLRWVLPDFRHYSEASTWVENGFDVQFMSTILACIATTLGYFLPCFSIGYFSLLIRELESK